MQRDMTNRREIANDGYLTAERFLIHVMHRIWRIHPILVLHAAKFTVHINELCGTGIPVPLHGALNHFVGAAHSRM